LEDAMKRLVELVVTAAMLTIPAAASAQTLTEAQARAAIAPWYQLFKRIGNINALRRRAPPSWPPSP
jgi:hypothetical protein